MKTIATLTMILALSVAVAAENGMKKNDVKPEKKNGAATEQQISPQMREMMKEAGVSEEMLVRTQALSNAPLYLDSAPALLGMSDFLELTDEQKMKLERINRLSRAQSLRVLNDDQRQKLGQIPEEPATPMEMALQIHQRMAPVVQRRMQQQREGAGGANGHEEDLDEEEGVEGEGVQPDPENGGQIPEAEEHELE